MNFRNNSNKNYINYRKTSEEIPEEVNEEISRDFFLIPEGFPGETPEGAPGEILDGILLRILREREVKPGGEYS